MEHLLVVAVIRSVDLRGQVNEEIIHTYNIMRMRPRRLSWAFLVSSKAIRAAKAVTIVTGDNVALRYSCVPVYKPFKSFMHNIVNKVENMWISLWIR
jgi:hypothetical protein